MRFVVLLGAFVLFLAGYATYVAFLRPAPEFDGATDPAHVAAVEALIAAVAAPIGTTTDPYDTWCGSTAAACWTSTSQSPKALLSALSHTLVAAGGQVRSHSCSKPETVPISAPQGACRAVLDYHGSRIDLIASSHGESENGGRTYLRLDSPLVNSPGGSVHAAPLGPWASVDPLPAAWTTGATCGQPTNDGCGAYRHPSPSRVIPLPLASVCAGVRASMRGRFFFDIDEDKPATGSTPAYCRIVTHLFRSLAGRDGVLVIVGATSVDATSTTLSYDVGAG